MITYISNGTGTLFDTVDERALATVDYRICRIPAHEGKAEEWWGRFALTQPVPDLAEYLIELEDGRKGACILARGKSHQMLGSDTYHHYELTGIGELGGKPEPE